MNRLVIERGPSTNVGTFGKATLVNAAGVTLWSGDSLELPWRDNQTDISCVPPGTYGTQIVYFAKIRLNVYELLNVPGRTQCLIHPANWAGDTNLGFHTDLEGCTGLGYGTGGIPRPDNGVLQEAILRTVDAITDFMKAAAGDTLEVQYLWSDGCTPTS